MNNPNSRGAKLIDPSTVVAVIAGLEPASSSPRTIMYTHGRRIGPRPIGVQGRRCAPAAKTSVARVILCLQRSLQISKKTNCVGDHVRQRRQHCRARSQSIGVVLLFRYGMPFHVPTGGISRLALEGIDQAEVALEGKYWGISD